MRPNLFIVGAPKCGTTAWVSYLSSHKDIFFSPIKEPHYFCEDFPGFRWIKSADDYDKLFEGVSGETVIGEASVQYLYSKVAARNIHAFNPDAKILIFLRDHSSFLPSYHNQLLYNRDEAISDFAQAWRSSLEGRDNIPETCREPAFLDYPSVGRFSEQIERYLNLFGPEQVKIIWFDHWVKDARPTYLELMAFLGIEDDGRDHFEPIHEAKHHRSETLSNLTQRPPGFVVATVRMIKRLLGRERLGAAGFLRKLNSAKGYSDSVDAQVKDEIDQYFSGEVEKVRKALAKQAAYNSA